MFPARCRIEPCMNMEVKTVTQVAGWPAAPPGPHVIVWPASMQWSPGCVSSNGIAP